MSKDSKKSGKQTTPITSFGNEPSTSSVALAKHNIKQEAEKIKKDLLDYSLKQDINGVIHYITEHIDDIKKVYSKYGSGNEYLFEAYHNTHILYPRFAIAYQECLESKIAGDVLFLDE